MLRAGSTVVALRALALLTSLAFAATVAASDRIFLNAGAIDTASDYAQTQRASAVLGSFIGKRLHLVQFTGSIRQQWVDSLAADGLRVVNYIPDNAYLVWGDAAAIAQLQARVRAAASSVQWDGAWKAEYKVHPAVWASEKDLGRPLAARTPGTDRFSVQLVADDAENASTLKELAALGGTVFADPGALPGFVNLNVTLPAAALAAFANRADIVSIHRYIEPQQNDERQSLILAGNLTGNGPTPGNYFDRLTAWGFSQSQFDTSGFVVDVTDDGADVNPSGGIPANSVAGPVAANHFVFFQGGNRPIGAATPSGTSRFVYKGRFGAAGTDGGLGYGGHGQLNMSIVGGYVPTGSLGGVDFGIFPHSDASAFRFGLGVAPFVRLGNSVIFDPDYTDPSYPMMLSAGYAANARISTNSWGAPTAGAYTIDSQTYDGLVRDAQAGTAGAQQMVIVFSAGNSGSAASTVGSPGTAKNVVTVGAAENVQPFGGADGCGITDVGADSANDIISFSSRGPTTDGRRKPDLVGPGTHVSGIAFVTPTSTGNATAQPGYRGDGVCGGVPPSIPFPAGQNWYTASSGTSHSTPAAAGGAALIFQQFLNNPPYLAANRVPASGLPSPALVKAYMMNSTRYMNGVGANDTLWSTAQGMGMMNLGTAFDGVSRATRDQVPVERLIASGQQRQYSGTISDPSKPFRVTLAWTDAPGATSGNAYVNNLDLQVTVGGNTYLGNVFSGANSTTGGVADPRNNVESVFLPAGASGDFTIIVPATNIAGQADPTVAGNNQDFALVAYNSGPLVPFTAPALVVGSNTVTTGNGIIEPNECNALTSILINGGLGGATAVSSVLSTATPGVVIAQQNSAYPDLAAGGSGANLSAFQISTSPTVACGSTINFAHTVTYTGGGSPATLNFTLPVGQLAAVNYAFTSSSGTIPAGGTLIAGTQADDAVAAVAAPFTFSVYGTTVTAGSNITVSTNGNVQLVPSGGASALTNGALPSGGTFPAAAPTLFPYWDDLDLRVAGYGVFADTTGVAPNRTFKLEWRGLIFGGTNAVNFAVLFREGSSDFEYVYNNSAAANGSSATVGVQAASSGTTFTQFGVNQAVVTAGLKLSATRPPGICTPGPAQCGPPTAPAITSANATTFAVGAAGTFTFAATGAPTPAIAVAGALPSGVSYTAATRTLAGTPAAGTGGSYPLTVTAANGVPPDAVQNFTLGVNMAPAFTGPAPPAVAAVGVPYSHGFTATGFPAPTFSATGMPAWLTIDTVTGLMSGTPPNAVGSPFGIVVTASNGVAPNATRNFTLTVGTTVVSLASSAPTVPAGTGVTLTATVSGVAPTGTVAFRNGPQVLAGCGEVALVGSGNVRTAQCNTGALAVGSYEFTAVYSGDGANGTAEGTTAQTATAVSGQACNTFTDVDSGSVFCPNVEWLKNRIVTLGCTSATLYCPTDSVVRLSMAAFMNRLGTALTGAVSAAEASPGAVTVGAGTVVCQTTGFVASGFARRAQVDAVFMGTAAAQTPFGADLVASYDAGATWAPLSATASRSTIPAGRWANLRAVGSQDVAVGQTVRFGLLLTHGGLAGPAALSDSRCNVRAVFGNRNSTFSPFDAAN